MSTALTLPGAAGQAFDNLNVRWLANQLKSALTLFWKNNLPSFPEQQVDAHPVSNWLTIIAALADQMPATNVPLEQLTAAAEFVYRLCWMADALQTSGGITALQATNLRLSYNAIIGF